MEKPNASKHGSTISAEPQRLNLSFPTLSADGSVEDLNDNIHDHTMPPSSPSRLPGEATSSLEDSTYDLVSNSDLSESAILSDDEAHTVSLSSYDGNTPDDISIITSEGEDETDEEEGAALNTPLESVLMFGGRQAEAEASSNTESLVNITPTIDDSSWSARTIRPEQSLPELIHTEQSLEYVQFREDRVRSADPAIKNLVHTVQSIDEVTCKRELEYAYACKHVGVDMHMAISNAPLPCLDSFRLLIITSNTHFNNEIAEHILCAVTASLPVKTEKVAMTMQNCVGASFAADRQEVIIEVEDMLSQPITLRGGRAYLEDVPYLSWNLAIFLHDSPANIRPEDMPYLERMFSTAQLGLRATRVPTMHLSLWQPLYQTVPALFTCDRNSLHLTVTTKNGFGKEVLRELLPVEVDQFLAIDPNLLNLHLSCIMESEPTNGEPKRHFQTSLAQLLRTNCANTYRASKKELRWAYDVGSQSLASILRSRNFLHLLAGMVLALFAITLCAQLPSLLYSTPIGPSTPVETTILQTSHAANPMPGIFQWPSSTSTDSLSASSSAVKSAAREMSETRIAPQASNDAAYQAWKSRRLLEEEQDLIAKSSQEWSIANILDDNFTINFPPSLVKYIKGQPTFQVKCESVAMTPKAKQVVAGSWLINIPTSIVRQDACLLVVQVLCHLPQLGRYNLAHDFSLQQERTPLEKVKDLVAQEFILVQDNVVALSTRMTTGLQQYIDEFQQHTLSITNQAIKRANDTRNALVSLARTEYSVTSWESRKERLQRLKKTKKALRKQGKDIAAQLDVTLRTVHETALQRYDAAMNMIQSLNHWRGKTKWPVRASDWTPKAAAQRGVGNARGLLRKIQGPAKSTTDCAQSCPRARRMGRKARREYKKKCKSCKQHR